MFGLVRQSATTPGSGDVGGLACEVLADGELAAAGTVVVCEAEGGVVAPVLVGVDAAECWLRAAVERVDPHAVVARLSPRSMPAVSAICAFRVTPL